MSFERAVLGAVAGLALAGVVVWALVSMAWASDNLFRLTKVAIGMGLALGGPALLFLLVWPFRRRRRSSRP
jgi:hypothetical protein